MNANYLRKLHEKSRCTICGGPPETIEIDCGDYALMLAGQIMVTIRCHGLVWRQPVDCLEIYTDKIAAITVPPPPPPFNASLLA